MCVGCLTLSISVIGLFPTLVLSLLLHFLQAFPCETLSLTLIGFPTYGKEFPVLNWGAWDYEVGNSCGKPCNPQLQVQLVWLDAVLAIMMTTNIGAMLQGIAQKLYMKYGIHKKVNVWSLFIMRFNVTQILL